MLLKPQAFTASGASNRQEQSFEYAHRKSHPLLQFLPQKLSEWIAANLADELELPPKTGPGDTWSSEDLNRILLWCCVADSKGNNLHTFNSLEFESDLYRGIMRARCYPFDMDDHRFHGKNIKVVQLKFMYIHTYISVYTYQIYGIYIQYILYFIVYTYHMSGIPSFRTVWPQSPLIPTTLALVMHSTTLQLLFPTQTACGLFDLSSTSLALCAH